MNGVAAVLFILVSHVAWQALLIAAGSVIGGQIGAKVGGARDRTSARLVVLVSVVAIVQIVQAE